MRSSVLTILSAIVLLQSLSGCVDKDVEHRNVSIGQVPNIDIALDTAVIRELIVPSDIYDVGGDLVVVNSAKDKGNVLYRYGDDLHFKDSFFSYGRADNEFTVVSGSLSQDNDSTLCLYTDLFDCTEFIVTDSGMTIGAKQKILGDIQNNVVILNDSLVLYRTRMKEYPYYVYNYVRQEEVCGFGDYPESSLKYKNRNDRDNICLSNMVYGKSADRLVAFYESIPVFRIYDAVSYSLLKEVRIEDAQRQTASLEDFYDWRSVFYFQKPIAGTDYIYVNYVNSTVTDDAPDNMVLLKMDWDGSVVGKYTLDRYCRMYTVSDDGVFYGISIENGEYVLCKAELPFYFEPERNWNMEFSGQADKVIDLRDVEPCSVGISSFTTGIETIKLETSEESMIGFFSSVRIDSVNIYIMDMLYRGIHIFRRSDGKYVSGFRKQGRGHGEYVDISDFFIDHGNNTLEILDGGTQRLLLYDLDTFEYISEIKIPVLAGKFEKSVDEGVYYFDTRHFTNYVNGEKTNSGVIAFNPSDMSCEVLFDYDLPENRSFNIRGFSVNETGEIYYSQMWDNTFYCIRGKKSVPVLSVDPGRKGIPENIAAGSYDMQERFIQERRPGYMSFRLSYYDGKRCIITFADGGKSMFYISDGASELVADKIVADFIDGSPSIDAVNMLILGDMILVVWFPGEEQSEEAAAFLDGMDIMPDDNPVITLFKLE